MDIEQLKLILDMLGAAGEGSVNLFLIYLAYLTVQNLIMYAVPIVFFTLGYKAIHGAWAKASDATEKALYKEIALTCFDKNWMRETERAEILGAVRAHRASKDA